MNLLFLLKCTTINYVRFFYLIESSIYMYVCITLFCHFITFRFRESSGFVIREFLYVIRIRGGGSSGVGFVRSFLRRSKPSLSRLISRIGSFYKISLSTRLPLEHPYFWTHSSHTRYYRSIHPYCPLSIRIGYDKKRSRNNSQRESISQT